MQVLSAKVKNKFVGDYRTALFAFAVYRARNRKCVKSELKRQTSQKRQQSKQRETKLQRRSVERQQYIK